MAEQRQNAAKIGLNLDNNTSDIKAGQVSYALNAVVEGYDGKSITYQNEAGNVPCGSHPASLFVIGEKYVPQRNITILFLTDNTNHEIGYHDINTCTYTRIIGGSCLNFHKDFPIHKSVTKTVSEKELEIYWADGRNPMRYMNIDNPPYITVKQDCDEEVTTILDCNRLNVQPKLKIPRITLKEIANGGDLQEGTYQFAVQYANGAGEPYTSFFMVTNPISIGDPTQIGTDFSPKIDKSIILNVLNIDNSDVFEYLNVAVVKKINNIPSFELVDTYRISGDSLVVNYTGQSKQNVRLSVDDIFEKFTMYAQAGDVIAAGDIIIWSDLKSTERINYQKIWNKVHLTWESWRLPYGQGVDYAEAENTLYFKGYFRDEVYAFEGAFLFDDGTNSDYFHIPGRPATPYDLDIINNSDAQDSLENCDPPSTGKPRWEVYNTASVIKRTTNCTQVTTPGETTTKEVTIGVTAICNDAGCSQQSETELTLNLNTPLNNSVQVFIGLIEQHPDASKGAYGYDIFTVPGGVVSTPGWSKPFVITIPAGVTTVTIPAKIFTTSAIYAPNGNRIDVWTCHSCQRKIVDFYIKGTPGVNINFTSTQGTNVHNIHDGPVMTVTTTTDPTTVETCVDDCYKGPWEEGEFSYFESSDLYDCDEQWEDLANTPIRHHKLPDCLISPHHDNEGNIYPIGIRLNIDDLKYLVANSSLTEDQKKRIVGFTIGRGNRATNKTIVAKGLLYNVGLYKKENQEYLYPNYPYNDLREDPFILSDTQSVSSSTGFSNKCYNYTITKLADSNADVGFTYRGCDDTSHVGTTNGSQTVCAQEFPSITSGSGTITVGGECGSQAPPAPNQRVQLNGFEEDDSKERYTFHSPDTHFYQPFLGSKLKLETVEYGNSFGHFVEVKNHAKYGFISERGYTAIIVAANVLGAISGLTMGTYGAGAVTAIAIFQAPAYDGGRAAITVFQAVVQFIEILEKIIPRLNFAYQYTSIGNYDRTLPIQNNGSKVRAIDHAQYLTSGHQSVSENRTLNNYHRESSVYVRTGLTLPFPHEAGGPQDTSRWILSENNQCKEPTKIQQRPISSYYGSIKKDISNPYGRLFSYETISTGYSFLFSGAQQGQTTLFGGDCFINKFSLKRKLPYFFDNKVGYPDMADVDYRDFFNVGYSRYWISTDYTGGGGLLSELFGIKQNSFDCQDDGFTYQRGKFYLFNYGIPTFYCESEVNVDLRKATNALEGDYYPRVSSGIPDEWLQEINVKIAQDNTYNYNKTFSTQNKENVVSHIPIDFDPLKDSVKQLPNRCFYSDPQGDYVNYKRNNWLIYRPISYFDFPLNYGKLIALESMENKAVLARFETKSLIYNALLTAPTSAADVYVGQTVFSRQVPPLDFAETGFGFNGTLNKMYIKTEHGALTIDSKKGQIFLIQGNSIEELSSAKYNCSKFFAENLKFKITQHFPVPVDNHFQSLGLHGVYDSKNDRIIITKFDYEPIVSGIRYENGKFYKNTTEVSLQDTNYFCNRSFTVSFNFVIGAWIGFHSYLPNYYVGTGDNFLSGINTSNGIWKHGSQFTLYNNFYGAISPYTLEYPFQYRTIDEMIQSVSDYTKVFKYSGDIQSFVEQDEIYFTTGMIYNNEQNTGIMKFIPKKKNNMASYIGYPKYTPTGKEILFVKSANDYNYNSIRDAVVDPYQPIWKKSCVSLSIDKELTDNIDFVRRNKQTLIRGREAKIRHTLSHTSDYRFISQFILTDNQNSY